MTVASHDRERILVLVRGRRDGEVTHALLTRAGLTAHVAADADELCAELQRGAAAVLVAEESLTKPAISALRSTLDAQPVWSDLPVIVFSTHGELGAGRGSDAIQELGNVTFLDRPVQVRSMLAAVSAAIRSRRRQYEAGRAIESRDAFLAMLGHELRNPLGAIRLAVALSEAKGVDRDPKTELSIIDRQSLHLSRIVDDLLDVARVTRGKVVLKLERLSIVEAVRNAYELMKRVAADQLATFDLVVDDEDLAVDGDRQRLEQVFTNLLTNAIKYTPRGGSVTVRVRAEGDRAVVAVEDTGMGLAPEMRERVFEVFAQAERSLDRSQGGIGIGLALVRGIAELHGGEVHAESDGLGKGSRFVLSLPRAPSPAPALDTPVPPPSRVPAKRVVVVEDNEDMRDLIVLLLEDAGHEVTCAKAGPEGLEKILSVKPDIAFVDIGLPHMDGLEVARRVRAARSAVRLIAMTGYGQVEDKEHAHEAGFDAHLTKPVESAALYRELEAL